MSPSHPLPAPDPVLGLTEAVATIPINALDDLPWARCGDSARHGGDEWVRSDGATLVVTWDGEFLIGYYPLGIDNHEAAWPTMWSVGSTMDVADILLRFGIVVKIGVDHLWSFAEAERA